MPIINLNEVTENARPFLPSNTYTIRVADAESKTSNAGNLMIRAFWKKSLSEVVYKLGEHNLRLKSE
jgi:hypothetical protein